MFVHKVLKHECVLAGNALVLVKLRESVFFPRALCAFRHAMVILISPLSLSPAARIAYSGQGKPQNKGPVTSTTYSILNPSLWPLS